MGFAADAVVAVHGVFVVFLVVGGFVAWWWPLVAPLHILALVASSGIYLGGLDCPLTNLEKDLRARAGEDVYPDGWIAHYLVRPFYADGMTKALGLAIVGVVVVPSVVAYGRHLI